MNTLFLYNATQTYTNTVFEHLNCFARYSVNRFFFGHQDQHMTFNFDLSRFDAVILHYSVRLPYDQVADSTVEALIRYSGLKVLFIQDEYEHTHRAWYWIKRLGIHLVFTVVPPEGIARIYPPEQFPGVRFVSNITGYVPEELPAENTIRPPSTREVIVGYRGRPLPIRYGQLGQEKVGIGRLVRQYCVSNGIRHDIAWTEDARIYGSKWYEFIASCRAMLGSESGSNVFDWDGTLASHAEAFLVINREATNEKIYRSVIEPLEIPGIMNQVSPRIFEAIVSRTVLVLFEGNYSGVVVPDRHFIPLKKDGSNLDDVFSLLRDSRYVDEMTERAYQEIIVPGRYSYQAFVRMVDEQVVQSIKSLGLQKKGHLPEADMVDRGEEPSPLTTFPIRALPPQEQLKQNQLKRTLSKRIAHRAWGLLPEGVRKPLKPRLKKILT